MIFLVSCGRRDSSINATIFDGPVPAGGTISSGAGTNSITVDVAAGAADLTIEVYPENGCGSGLPASTFPVTVDPMPIGGADTDNTCSDVALSYDLQNNINTLGNSQLSTFSWVATANGNVAGESTAPQAGGTINDVVTNLTGSDEDVVYTVTPTGTNGCPGDPFIVTVTVKSEPVGGADTDNTCSDVALSYDLQVTNINTLGNSQASNFSWVAAANGNVTGESTVPQAGATINDVVTNLTGTDEDVVYTVTPTGTNGCLGDPFIVTVTVKS